jgi:hypothetical protein
MLIPHELAHALHFSLLSEGQRGSAQDSYLGFITGDVIGGGPGTHDFARPTRRVVAYIEAAGWYSDRFIEGSPAFATPETITLALQQEFLAAEWAKVTEPSLLLRIIQSIGLLRVLSPVLRLFGSRPRLLGVVSTTRALRSHFQPAVVDEHGVKDQNGVRIRGADMEGAVYAAIFVDFAGIVGLDVAASAYFAADALEFEDYRRFINTHHPEFAATLEEVGEFWGV